MIFVIAILSYIGDVLAHPPKYGGEIVSTVTINESVTFQRFDGMGISEAFQRGTQIYGADGLSAANTEYVLDLLFSTAGAGMTILRNGIGSSLRNPYDLMKTIEPVSPGSPDATPQYDWQGTIKPGFGLDNGQLQLTKDALARGVKYIYADAWSAPGFMKNNSNDSYGGALCGVSGVDCDGDDWRRPYAEYLVQYLTLYDQEGAPINYVGFLNEPDLNVSYASMLSNGRQAADFIEVLHPILQASGLSTQIACCDGSGWEQNRERLTGIQAAGAEDLLGLVTSHGYSSYPGAPFKTTRPVWETEWADLEGIPTLAWHTDFSSGEGITWANNIHNVFTTSNASAFLYWIGAGNTTTNSALVLLDGNTVHVSKRLWAFAQYSRFVKPGAVRISALASTSALNVTAYRNADSSISVQVINNGGESRNVHLDGLTDVTAHRRGWQWWTGVKTYLTDNENDLSEGRAQPLRDGSVRAIVPAYSMMSFFME